MKVYNKRDRNIPAGAVYIGRPTKWGNPFVIGKDGTREEVCRKYQVHLLNSPSLMASLDDLRGKDLVCWCAPLQCHGDVIINVLDLLHEDDYLMED